MSKQTENTAIAVQNPGYLALADSDFTADIGAEMNGLELSFEKIKIPSGGGLAFEIPGEDSEADTVKEFSGVILHHHPVFMRYDDKYTGGNSPPDCGSFDGRVGKGNPGGDCKTCPHNQFGTGENGAKACKNRQRIYILREGELFPMVLSLPTGSLKVFSKFVASQLSKGRKVSRYVTRFSLRKATNSGGIVYSQAQFKVDRILTNEEIPLVAAFAEQIKLYSQNADFDAQAEVINVDEETGEVVQPLDGGANV
jgi:hypothetical protein